MLELKNVKKRYVVGDIETKALDGISVAFREKEFVAILGTSGSGKTTALNIIGGLDHYDSGDLIIKGKQTSKFTAHDWDAYRNNSVGFVFQSYNLITHLSIVANVELGMTLSGVSKAEKHRRALQVLEDVGLKEHLHKKPNQLSGGQMQRVAIARALANDPEILLCDEPTGALDTTTSTQIMDLIKAVAKDRLVIMVTHNPDIANQYADRIIRFQDGKIIDDSHPHEERPKPDMFNLKKTAMKFRTALNLSFNNIMTKKGRTFLTAFASSIGIIGIAVILSLSNGFQLQIDKFQSDAIAEFPVIISQSTQSVNIEEMQNRAGNASEEKAVPEDEIVLYDPNKFIKIHTNNFTDEFLTHLGSISPDYCSSIGYTRLVSMNIIRKDEDSYNNVSFGAMSDMLSGGGSNIMSSMTSMTSMSGAGLSSYPASVDPDGAPYLERYYDLLYGEYPTEPTDLVLVVGNNHRMPVSTMEALGFDVEGVDTIKFSDVIGMELKVIDNNDYYVATDMGTYLPNMDTEAMYNSDDSITLRVVGIITQGEGSSIGLLGRGIAYSDDLCTLVIDNALESDIVKAQSTADYNIFTRGELDEMSKQMILATLGGTASPFMIMLYPTDFAGKSDMLAYIDEYNDDKDVDDQIVYSDLAGSLTDLTSGIMDAITVVLIAFAAISLVVSLIMISIITYTSVLERTKEIGILRALGARKKDITRVFDAETFIIGVFSGLIGVICAYLLTFPANAIIYSMTNLEGVAQLNIIHVILLLVISTILTVLGGHIPARMASKKDAVEALRSE